MIPTLSLSYVKMLFNRPRELTRAFHHGIDFLTTRHLQNHLSAIALLVMVMAQPAVAVAQSAESLKTQEYFVRQSADEDLLITIKAFEAEFESKIAGPNGEVLLFSVVPGSRLIPVFQYVNAPKKDRQLDIEVTSHLHTARSEFGLELTRLKVWDQRSSSVSRAYKLLSFGMLAQTDADEANWTVKIGSLVNAGDLFRQFGMKEMRLWSNYLAAHLIQAHLHDYAIVLNMTGEILADLKGTRLQEIELATLQLQSAALIGLKKPAPAKTSGTDPVQSVLARTAALAASMGYRYEQANALNTSGAQYAADSLYSKALEQYQLAVQIADSVADTELATAIRESIVDIHAIEGNAPASGQVLREIESQLLEEGGGDELALNLLAQGRLLINSYRYDRAAGVLYQALEHENDSAIRRQINFDLANVFYETGRLDESLAHLKLAGVHRGADRQKRISAVIDIGKGFEMIAGIQRSRGEFTQMHQARAAQGLYKPETARYRYQQGLDELARAGRTNQRAADFFRQSYQAAVKTGSLDLQHLARLQLCALGSSGDPLCSSTLVKASYTSLVNGGLPRFSTQAMFLWVQILILNGRHSEAVVSMDRLLDEILFMRHSLPGVLGAWYSGRHQQIFDGYLAMLTMTSAPGAGVDGAVSLLALSKIRHIVKLNAPDMVLNGTSGSTDLLRVQLAQRAGSKPRQTTSALNASINRGLAAIRAGFRKDFEYLSKTSIQKYLAGLSNNEIVLTYHISPKIAQVWVGYKGRVVRRSIAGPAKLYADLQAARRALAESGWSSFNNYADALGKRLISPVADLLKQRIYWIPAGPLLGIPLDALRSNGRYLLERHSVVNLVSFPANLKPTLSLQAGPLQNVFIAGHPQDYSGDYATRLDTSSEISAVADVFIGPGLNIVQGVALLPDEFKAVHYQQASLVHLSMPGTIDLQYPQRSGLELSGSEFNAEREVLTPGEIRSQQVVADLVFLSATSVKKDPFSSFSSQPGLVSDFLEAGARSVIVNLWASGDKTDEAFISDFYRRLQISGNIAGSLQQAKQKYLQGHRGSEPLSWAGYQLFID